MIGTRPLNAASQASARRASGNPLCSTATSCPKRSSNRRRTWIVNAISGTSTIAPRPRRRTSSIARRYTSVFPDPVTPCNRNV